MKPNLKIVLEITSEVIEHDTPEKNTGHTEESYSFSNIQYKTKWRLRDVTLIKVSVAFPVLEIDTVLRG